MNVNMKPPPQHTKNMMIRINYFIYLIDERKKKMRYLRDRYTYNIDVMSLFENPIYNIHANISN